ncbi:MAG TPA: NAD(P)/FAD-dependent oxidoreductase [Pseudonocardiaceae bacterium]|nr:NAD(P)/FAD-dependent oxidoreductase [Pseudonocardiaceae bacterium]
MRDLIVVGAGPAGLATALGAARAGLDVLVFERRTSPIDKACGEGLMPSAVRALAALGVDPPGFPLRGISYRRGSTIAHAEFRSGPGRGVRRTALQGALREAVDLAGIPVKERRVTDLEHSDDRVTVAGESARYLVAADGLHSPIRTKLGLAAPATGLNRWGFRQHFAIPPVDDFVEVNWSDHAEAYVTPVGPDIIGISLLTSRRGSFDSHLAAFPSLAGRLARARAVSDVRGAGPLRQRVRGRVSGRVLLIGDAAGYVDALTGEGIAISLASAAELVRCVVADRPQDYETAWRSVSRRSRMLTEGLLWARQRPGVPRVIVPLATRLPWLFRLIVNQLAG